MSRSTSQTVSRAMFFKHRAEWIRRVVVKYPTGPNPGEFYEALSEAWDRGVAQGRKMEKKGLAQ